MKRRDFLKNAGAAIVPAALPAALWAAPPLEPANESTRDKGRLFAREQVPVTVVLYDERYADCRAFALALELHGAKVFATNQDSVALWYGPLRAHLEKNPGRVAGLATYADFSSSIACGRELALALRVEGHHDSRSSRSATTHRLTTRAPETPNRVGLADPKDIAASLKTEAWASQLAEALWRIGEPIPASVLGAPPSITKKWPKSLEAETQTPRSSDHPSYLASWLLSL